MTNATTPRCPFLAQLSDMPRLTEARYEDGLGALYADGADPAEVAQQIFDQDGDMPNSAGLSAMFTTWGQFLDHDLSLTPEGEHGETMADGLGHDIARSDFAPGSGVDGPRIQQNAITWQIDGNNVYGSNDLREEDVRSHEGGKLKLIDDASSDRGLLPKANPDLIMAGELEGDDPVFLAGDVRANENPNLLAMHTLWAREHNYWAERLAEEHPDWDDDDLFDGARQIVEYEMQKITYEEWLPHLIGNVIDPSAVAHDPDANGEVAIEFSTAAFRFGHTMVSSQLERVNEDGTEAEGGHLGLMDAFFNHHPVQDGGIDSLMRGQAGQSAQELDTKVIDDLNFFLATPDGVSGFSLVALNLMRGFDHGLQGYIDTRAALIGDIDPDTLDPNDFSVITSDSDLQVELAAVYDDIFQVDLWVGGLAEDKMAGTQAGPLFTHIISDQFMRTASADETFFELDPALGASIIADAQASTLSGVILRNTDIDTMQDDVFIVEDRELIENWEDHGTPLDDTILLLANSIADGVHLLQGHDHLTLQGGTTIGEDILMGDGNDTLIATSGDVDGFINSDDLSGSGDDLVDLGGTFNVDHDVQTNGGDDEVILRDMARVGDDVMTGTGDDTVRLENKATIEDDLFLSLGDDEVHLGARTTVDRVDMGHGQDDVVVESGANVTHIDGGEEGCVPADDNAVQDVLRIDGRYRVEYAGGQPNAEAGTVFYLDDDGNDTGETFTFEGFESVTCFTRGTRIVTARGKLRIEEIGVGAKVMTIDNGLQPVRWIGRRLMPALGRFAPIEIAPGALGNTERLLVSPQHRMVLGSAFAEMLFGAEDVLAPAKTLVNGTTIRAREGGMVEYFHLMFDSHQIVLAEGIPSESFHPGDIALGALSEASRDELFGIFPELAPCPHAYGPSARKSLKRREAELLAAMLYQECNPE